MTNNLSDMLFLPIATLYLYLISPTYTVEIKIDGLIDFGKKWSYAYTMELPDFLTATTQHVMRTPAWDSHESKSKNSKPNVKSVAHKGKKNKSAVLSNSIKANMTKRLNITKVDSLKENIKNDLTMSGIFGKHFKDKNNTIVMTFADHILKSGLNVFHTIKKQSSDHTVKREMDALAERYEYRYKEFIRQSLRHEIKTRLGAQRALLNAIDASNLIMKRLINFVFVDLNQKGNLRENIGATNSLKQKVEKEHNSELSRVCKKYNICRSANGFSEFLTEFLSIVLRCNDYKLRQAIDSFTEVTKNMNFDSIFRQKTQHKIFRTVAHIENKDMDELKPGFMIIKNIIANRNQPLVVERSEMHTCRVNATLALIEIIDTLDEIIPRTVENGKLWHELLSNLLDWEKGTRSDVQLVVESLMKNIAEGLEKTLFDTQEHVAKNIARLLK